MGEFIDFAMFVGGAIAWIYCLIETRDAGTPLRWGIWGVGMMAMGAQ